MTENKVYIKYFRHFAERLALRYGILITFEKYIELCSLELKVIEVQTERDKGNRKTQIGYLNIEGRNVKVIKPLYIKEKPLTTALPMQSFIKSNCHYL